MAKTPALKKIPAPKAVGDCTSIGGITVCPHLVHLTKKQMAEVKKMHLENVKKLKKPKTARS